MFHREKAAKIRTSGNPWGVIFPVVIDDGNCFPSEVQAIQAEKLHAYANPFMRLDSPRQEELAEVLKSKFCAVIEQALEKVPKYDETWEEVAHEQFEGLFKIQVQPQITIPSIELPIK